MKLYVNNSVLLKPPLNDRVETWEENLKADPEPLAVLWQWRPPVAAARLCVCFHPVLQYFLTRWVNSPLQDFLWQANTESLQQGKFRVKCVTRQNDPEDGFKPKEKNKGGGGGGQPSVSLVLTRLTSDLFTNK